MVPSVVTPWNATLNVICQRVIDIQISFNVRSLSEHISWIATFVDGKIYSLLGCVWTTRIADQIEMTISSASPEWGHRGREWKKNRRIWPPWFSSIVSLLHSVVLPLSVMCHDLPIVTVIREREACRASQGWLEELLHPSGKLVIESSFTLSQEFFNDTRSMKTSLSQCVSKFDSSCLLKCRSPCPN